MARRRRRFGSRFSRRVRKARRLRGVRRLVIGNRW
jgi:hypothetical protein